MNSFDLCCTTRILFGKGQEAKVGGLIKEYGGSRVLLHYGGGSVIRSGLYDRVMESLKEAGLTVIPLGGAKPNPRLSLVHEGIALCRKENIDFLLAIGGGSAIDSAKAIAVGVSYEGDVWDLYETGTLAPSALPLATILTLPATGTEASSHSVITNEEKQLKIGYADERIRPRFSIINPELFFTLPHNQVANGVCDMMSHILERYLTNSIHTDLVDGLSEATLRTIMKNALRLKEDVTNYDAWGEVAMGGVIAHNDLLSMGRTEDWACHKMEHELSAIYDVAHGAGLAAITPSWMRYVYKENIPMFLQFAVKVMGVDGSFREPEDCILEGIRRLELFFHTMGLPNSIKELGIDSSQFEVMAKKATLFENGKERRLVGGVKKLGWKDVLAIYEMAKE